VVLTRESEDNRPLREALQKRGVPVREIPCLETRYIRPDEMPAPGYLAVTFSSRRGVRGVEHLGLADPLMPPGVLVAAVGPATAEELEQFGRRVDLVADPPTGEALAGMLLQKLPAGSRIVSVRGNLRTGNLDERLAEGGYRVESLEVYHNVDPGIPPMEPFPLSAVVVASPSACRRLVEKNPWIKQHRFYAIGPTTVAALAELHITRVRQLGPDRQGWVDELLTEET